VTVYCAAFLNEQQKLHVQRMQLAVADEISARAAFYARGLVHNALDDALKLGLITRNVAAAVNPIKYERPEFQIWSAEEIIRFLEHSKVSPYYSFSIVKNEAVLSSPKTKRGNRLIAIPWDTVGVLEEHREALSLNKSEGKLVFPSRTGTFLQHGNLIRTLRLYCGKAEVTPIRLHDLRHTYASMRIANGTDIVRLSRDLGHAKASFTLDVYAHFFARYQEREVPSLNELVGLEKAA